MYPANTSARWLGTAWFKSDKISNNKKKTSGWRPTIAFLYLFLFHSLLHLTSFLSQNENEIPLFPLLRIIHHELGMATEDTVAHAQIHHKLFFFLKATWYIGKHESPGKLAPPVSPWAAQEPSRQFKLSLSFSHISFFSLKFLFSSDLKKFHLLVIVLSDITKPQPFLTIVLKSVFALTGCTRSGKQSGSWNNRIFLASILWEEANVCVCVWERERERERQKREKEREREREREKDRREKKRERERERKRMRKRNGE